MLCVLTIARYPKGKSFFGFLSMALFRLPLMRNHNVSFYKLLGSGKNGTFDIKPDFQQWGIITATTLQHPVDTNNLYGKFITAWWKKNHCELFTIVLEPIEGHGLWDGIECFGPLPKQSAYNGVIAVLTRATIRLNKLKAFWQNVKDAAAPLAGTPGFITSVGIGEMPWIKQATFSIWQSKEQMKQYAYGTKQHAGVIRKTRSENWYSEEMFVRFKVLQCSGTLHGTNPLDGIMV